MRRAAALRAFGNVLFTLTWFKASFELENVHPVESGILRREFRRDRRPGLPIEPVWSFYPKYIAETARKQGIARMLVEAADQQLKKLGCGMVEVTSNDRLAAAHAFYRHMGYERTSIRFAKAL